jgi:ectoine hydroxylase-related dioxygenase (phytanoyl-CoA dioxygenase family)
MLTRKHGYLLPRKGGASPASEQLEREGYTVVRNALTPDEVAALRAEVEAVYANIPADLRQDRLPEDERNDFRYEMLNRSACAQATVGHRAILDVIEPLLGEDCHVIANTCWRNPPREKNMQGGGFWHIDAGPHIPRDSSIPWDDRIPYPVFAVGVHVYLKDCPLACGPTGVIPGSHKSGSVPPLDRLQDVDLTWNGRGVVPLEAKSGDAAFFVSDVWHRRLPTLPDDTGRLFLQIHYGRRDIAQRLRRTIDSNQLSAEAIERAVEPRQRTVVGLHQPFFYDG